ncbi:hypothetical protein BDZ89DRAFT_1060767 [Hymenopellis radicata]|nr:hypothetical protein BDZ89DRAFT_1060767 [Hymenopellis radicata]
MAATCRREDEYLNLSPPHFGRDGAPPVVPKHAHGDFLDTHIDDNLVLKRVQCHTDLITELAGYTDEKLASAREHIHFTDSMFGDSTVWYRQQSDMNTSEAIAKIQMFGPGLTASRLASTVLIHPQTPTAAPAMSWARARLDTCDPQSSNPFVTENYFLCCIDYSTAPSALLERHSPDTLPKLFALRKHNRLFAVGVFFCPSAHDILRGMGVLSETETFPWVSNSKPQRPSPAQAARPPDSPHPPWSLPNVMPVPQQERGIRRSTRIASPVVEYHAPGRVTPIGKVEWRNQPAQYVQRAWANAVRTDASVIIFDCGNYLRIGIRHRETQTLFLSELFDVCHCKAPAYGRVWAGIHLAIVDDILQRLEALHPASAERDASPISRPLSPDADAERPNKKVKPRRPRKPRTKNSSTVPKGKAPDHSTNAEAAPSRTIGGTVKQIEALHVSFQRHLTLAVYIRSGIYNSPSPSILLKPGKRRLAVYPSASYITLVLGSRLGRGATGDVYNATVPKAKHGPVVVKLATTFERLCRLRHEYSVYAHLEAAGVEYIPRLFGFYQDGHRNVGALVLGNAGDNLAARNGRLTDDQKEELRRALSAIHAAGVIHRDLRAWNILIDSSGRISIIDFDRAGTRPTAADIEKEVARLESFLNGELIDDGEIIGVDSMPANIGELVNDNREA